MVSSCSPGFQVGMRDLAAWGRALVSEQLLCQVKASGVTRCGVPYCLFPWLSLSFLPLSRFKLMKGLCSVWNCVFLLRNLLI